VGGCDNLVLLVTKTIPPNVYKQIKRKREGEIVTVGPGGMVKKGCLFADAAAPTQ